MTSPKTSKRQATCCCTFGNSQGGVQSRTLAAARKWHTCSSINFSIHPARRGEGVLNPMNPGFFKGELTPNFCDTKRWHAKVTDLSRFNTQTENQCLKSASQEDRQSLQVYSLGDISAQVSWTMLFFKSNKTNLQDDCNKLATSVPNSSYFHLFSGDQGQAATAWMKAMMLWCLDVLPKGRDFEAASGSLSLRSGLSSSRLDVWHGNDTHMYQWISAARTHAREQASERASDKANEKNTYFLIYPPETNISPGNRPSQ